MTAEDGANDTIAISRSKYIFLHFLCIKNKIHPEKEEKR